MADRYLRKYHNYFKRNNYLKKADGIKSNLIYESEKISSDRCRVTIAIPTFRRSSLLARAVRSAVSQEGAADYEVIVVDNDAEADKGTDRLMKTFCKNYPNIRYYRNEKNIGIDRNFNRCLQLARGKWAVFLSDDDVLYPSYLKNTLPCAEKYGCTYLGVFHENLYDDEFGNKNDGRYVSRLKFKQNILGSIRFHKPFLVKPADIFINVYASDAGVMIRKDLAVELGGFSSDMRFVVSEICDGKMMILPKFLVGRGIGKNDSLKKDYQEEIITMKYKIAMQMLRKGKLHFKRYKKFCADISARYMVESIHGHYNKDADFDQLLLELGVSKCVVNMPYGMVFFFKYLPLLRLIFRRVS